MGGSDLGPTIGHGLAPTPRLGGDVTGLASWPTHEPQGWRGCKGAYGSPDGWGTSPPP